VEEDKTHDVYAALVQTGDPVPALGVGTNVCVRNRFVGDWVTGFRVCSVTATAFDGFQMITSFPTYSRSTMSVWSDASNRCEG